MTTSNVTIEEYLTDVSVDEDRVTVVEVAVGGPQGPKGDPGEAGGTYRHVQSSPAAVWIVVHNLGYRPGGIYVQNSDFPPSQLWPRADHVDVNTLTLSFFVDGVPAAEAGEAHLS